MEHNEESLPLEGFFVFAGPFGLKVSANVLVPVLRLACKTGAAQAGGGSKPFDELRTPPRSEAAVPSSTAG
jgi:hypothetical protein